MRDPIRPSRNATWESLAAVYAGRGVRTRASVGSGNIECGIDDRQRTIDHVAKPDLATVGPFRWDLVSPDWLGSLLPGNAEPDLWFLDELTACAAKVLARSGGGRLIFVGRSADSIFDLLSGALAGTEWRDRLGRLPISAPWDREGLTPYEIARVRSILAGAGVTPARLARGRHPTALVDLVYGGNTFTWLFRILRTWVDEEREAWKAVRAKLRFIGITWRTETSPDTWRWQQHADWAHHLPARSVVNVSIDGQVWDYLGNRQVKLTPSFHRPLWVRPADGPRHDDETRQALAEAVALVRRGRTADVRRRMANVMTAEPAMSESWLRVLITQIGRAQPTRRRHSTGARSPIVRRSAAHPPPLRSSIDSSRSMPRCARTRASSGIRPSSRATRNTSRSALSISRRSRT